MATDTQITGEKIGHTPGPWERIDATQHHGFYITSPWGGTVCDLYTMSNPTAASVRNGGDSFPIAHQEGYDQANARLIAAAPELLAALVLAADQLLQIRNANDADDDDSYRADDREGCLDWTHAAADEAEKAARAALAKVTAA